jgi:hypothetical protein
MVFRRDSSFQEFQFCDDPVRLWAQAMQRFKEATELMDAKKTMWSQFRSPHRWFFKDLCITAKMKHAVAVVREAIKHGRCVMIALRVYRRSAHFAITEENPAILSARASSCRHWHGTASRHQIATIASVSVFNCITRVPSNISGLDAIIPPIERPLSHDAIMRNNWCSINHNL